MELTNTNVRYLLTIYHLSQARLEVSSKDIAQTLDVSRASVTSMMSILTDKRLVTKERYGKIALTERGTVLARRQEDYVRSLARQLPALGLDLTDQEAEEAALALAAVLPPRCRGGL